MEYDQLMYRYIIITFFTRFNIRQKTYHMLYMMMHGPFSKSLENIGQLKKKAKFKFKFEKIT